MADLLFTCFNVYSSSSNVNSISQDWTISCGSSQLLRLRPQGISHGMDAQIRWEMPNDILKIFSLKESENYIILIRSAIKKINDNSSWVKQMNDSALIIECKKLKSFEEKIWLKNQLEFVSEKHVKQYVDKISELFPGNLIAQQNEINLLKLMYEENEEVKTGLIFDGGEFHPFELEDKIIELNTT